MSLDGIATRIVRTGRTTAMASSAALCLIAAAASNQPASAQATAVPAGQASAKKVQQPKATPQPDPNAKDSGPEQATAPKKRDPAEAQRQIDAGIKHLQANKAEQAVQTLTYAISAGGLPPQQMARALHARGAAYRRTGKPAQAISDLTSALWIKGGLVDADRQDALKQRADAYREAGLPDQTTGDEAGRSPPRAARAATESPATAAPSSSVATASLAPDQQPATTPSTGGLFASLFGGLGKSAPPAQAERRAPAAPVPQRATTSGWSSTARAATEPAETAPPQVKAPRTRTAAVAQPSAIAAAAPAIVTPTPAAPGIHARIALVRSEQEAQTVVQKLKSNHAAAIGNRSTTLSQAAFGGMGTFVQVRVGPYASVAEAEGFCKKLKGSGLDCVPVDR